MNVRCCPNCEKALLPGNGVRFDDENNVICRHCQKPIVATTLATEHKITPKHKPEAVTTTYSAGTQKKTTFPRNGVSTPDNYHSHANHSYGGYGFPGQHQHQPELAGHGFIDGYGG